MMMHVMMQAMNDDDVYDITSLSNDESHKEHLWACLDIACKSPSNFPWHFISSQLVTMYIF
jgi:hypothetical protein